jgi:hypothetical protein
MIENKSDKWNFIQPEFIMCQTSKISTPAKSKNAEILPLGIFIVKNSNALVKF